MMAAFFKKTLSFLGLAEDDQEDYQTDEFSFRQDSYRQERKYVPENDYDEESGKRFSSNLRNLQKNDETPRKTWSNQRSSRKLLSLDSARDSKKLRVSVNEPHEFEEVQNIGDDLKMSIPVIVNLQNTNPDLSKRIIDFCSGLTYAVEGSIKKVADRVFLITPKDTLVTSNEKEILRERGLYNQL
jgi:cell division inhibitor SepF